MQDGVHRPGLPAAGGGLAGHRREPGGAHGAGKPWRHPRSGQRRRPPLPCAGQEGASKEKPPPHRMERYWDWFGVTAEFLPCDVTSTYFRGQAYPNDKVARGASRPSREDDTQGCIDGSARPKGSPSPWRSSPATVPGLPPSRRSSGGRRNASATPAGSGESSREGSAKKISTSCVGGGRFSSSAPRSRGGKTSRGHRPRRGIGRRAKARWKQAGSIPQRRRQRALRRMPQQRLGAPERTLLAGERDRWSEVLLKGERCRRRPPQVGTRLVERRIGPWQGRSPAAARWRETKLVFASEGRTSALRLSRPPPERGPPRLLEGKPPCRASLARRPIRPGGGAGTASSPRPRPPTARPSPTPAGGRSIPGDRPRGSPPAPRLSPSGPRAVPRVGEEWQGASAPVQQNRSNPSPPSAPRTSSCLGSKASARSNCEWPRPATPDEDRAVWWSPYGRHLPTDAPLFSKRADPNP